MQLDRPVRGDGARVLDRVVGQHGEVDGLSFELGRLVQAGERQQILDQYAHALGLLLDPPHRHLRAVLVRGRSHAEQLGVAADGGQRRAQLV